MTVMTYPDDHDLIALTVFSEAAGEPVDGMAAVVRVIQNRTRLKYQSDGTVRGTILHKAAFSEYGFDWVKDDAHPHGHYVPAPDAYSAQRVFTMMARARVQAVFSKCAAIVGGVLAGTYVGDTAYDHLTAKTVLYANLAIEQPAWAVPAKLITVIGHHSFYED